MKRELKQKPSKYDHMHNKTYISDYVPNFDEPHFDRWRQYGVKYKIP